MVVQPCFTLFSWSPVYFFDPKQICHPSYNIYKKKIWDAKTCFSVKCDVRLIKTIKLKIQKSKDFKPIYNCLMSLIFIRSKTEPMKPFGYLCVCYRLLWNQLLEKFTYTTHGLRMGMRWKTEYLDGPRAPLKESRNRLYIIVSC